MTVETHWLGCCPNAECDWVGPTRPTEDAARSDEYAHWAPAHGAQFVRSIMEPPPSGVAVCDRLDGDGNLQEES